jgi:hypothetical protein
MTGPAGPGAADLSPLIETAKGAAAACSFPAALASARQMTNFDPEHPWYLANRRKLEDLAGRQKRTENLVWQASSALKAEELKRARDLAAAAADSAVSCQTQAVSELLGGIDTAIEQRRLARTAARRRAAAAMLPGLINLSRAISGAESGLPGASEAIASAAVETVGGAVGVSVPDPCAFQFEYRDKGSVVPVCTCAGYGWNAASFRCSR